jgi:hypothetical protein
MGTVMSLSKIGFVLALVGCFVLAEHALAKKGGSRPPAAKRAAAAMKGAVTLEIAGPGDAQSAAAYQKALESSGLSARIHESKKGDRPLRVIAAVDKTTDLGPYGKAVMTAVPTKPGQLPAGLELMVYGTLTKDASQKVVAELEKVKGVDAKHSTIEVKKGSMRVRISGAGHVTAEDILKAVESAGIEPKLTREMHGKKAAT